jgi:hypothetical protein
MLCKALAGAPLRASRSVNAAFARRLVCVFCAGSLLQTAQAAPSPPPFEVRAYTNDTCIVADEPFFLPGTKEANSRFLPLLGLIVGKLAELFVNHEIAASAERIKSGAARKDTHYALVTQMNLYRVDFQSGPALSINAKLGCMTIVAATFKPEPASCTAEYLPKELTPETKDLTQAEWKTSRTDDSIENQLRRANVCVVGKAKAVYEGRFEFSKDGTAYRLKDAGYRIESLLTTSDKGASRTTLYTLKVSSPSVTEQQEVLTSAWVNIGTVSAGAHSNGSKGDGAPWLKVPPLSVEARRVYDEKTRLHQETMGEIEALKRAMTRDQRMLASLDQRIAGAGADTVDGLKQERNRIAVQYQSQGAELDARNAEYLDLPRTPLEIMPVTVEIAVTETESEKKAQLALADIIGKSGDLVGSAVGTSTTGLLSKSVSTSDIITEPDAADSATALADARSRYYDALVEAKSSAPGAASADAQRKLAAMKDRYNEARRSQGLEQIK